MAPPPVAEEARRLGIELYQPESVNDRTARVRIASETPEVLCLCAFGALITQPLLAEHVILNVHPSLLPRWRGAAPIERAIMAGDRETGISIMRLTEGFDSGPICLQAPESIADSDTYGTLAARLETLGARLLVRALDERPQCEPQVDADATYADKILPSDRRLDPQKKAISLERTVRALTPHIGAQLELADGTMLGVGAARVLDHGPPRGELSLIGPRPVLGCADGGLELMAVHPPGRRAMSGEEYLRGLRR
jgi:methionyl-tRNA formyltransferase